MQTEDDCLLAGVLAAPADDAPRLVYADWLDENGQPERAEFIRVQCKLVAPDCPTPTCIPPKSDYVTGMSAYTHHCRCAYCKLRRAEWKIWRRKGWDWQGEFYSLLAAATSSPWDAPLAPAGRCEFRRGFVDEIRLPLAAFMAGVHVIVHSQPVTRLLLTDKRPMGVVMSAGLRVGDAEVVLGPGYHFFRAARREPPPLAADELPDGIWQQRPANGWRFASERDAMDGLGDACLRWAREQEAGK